MQCISAPVSCATHQCCRNTVGAQERVELNVILRLESLQTLGKVWCMLTWLNIVNFTLHCTNVIITISMHYLHYNRRLTSLFFFFSFFPYAVVIFTLHARTY